MTTAGEAVQYLQWNKDVAHHDYAAASSYLSLDPPGNRDVFGRVNMKGAL